MEVAGETLQAKLKFTAPVKTSWSLKVTEERKGADGKTKDVTLLDESGDSDKVDYEFEALLKFTS